METPPHNGIIEEFRLEFLAFWNQMPNKGFFLTLLGAWFVLFHLLGNSTLGYARSPSLLGWMYETNASGGTNFLESEGAFSLLVPFIVLFLLWLKRRELLALKLQLWWPAMLLLVLALALHVLGYVVQQPRISIVAFFAGIYALTGLAWGPAWLRASFFPFFLFAFCVPLGSLAEPLTFRLRLLVSQLVELVSHFILAIDVVREGNILRDPSNRYSYEVAAACSGIRSFIATLALCVILAFVSCQKTWKRVLMIASALPLSVLGNLVRMLSIIIAAEIGGQSSGDWVHEGGPFGLFSLLPYLLAFAGLLVLEHYLREPGFESSGHNLAGKTA